jgi:hypothetical protein
VEFGFGLYGSSITPTLHDDDDDDDDDIEVN